MMSVIVLTPKRTVLGLNHVIWAMKLEYRSSGSSWALEREKRKDRTGKVTKWLYFTYLWRSTYWSDVHEKLFNSTWCSRLNHVCTPNVKTKFSWVTIVQGSNFPFSTWFLNGLTTVHDSLLGYSFCLVVWILVHQSGMSALATLLAGFVPLWSRWQSCDRTGWRACVVWWDV